MLSAISMGDEIYPFVISPAGENDIHKVKEEFVKLNGPEWQNVMIDKFTGFLQYATVGGITEKIEMKDYKLAIEKADEFLEKNKKLLGINDVKPVYVNVKTKNDNPQMGHVWVEYERQYQRKVPVEGTKIMVRVDYPGIVREIRCRWYPYVQFPYGTEIDKDEVRKVINGRNITYKGYGGQELIYIVQPRDIGDIEKVIFPLRKEREAKIEFYLCWKVIVNKDDVVNAWTIYIDVLSGKDVSIIKNFQKN